MVAAGIDVLHGGPYLDIGRRVTLDRLTPREAFDAQREGAILVDIRPASSREFEGLIPGALVMNQEDANLLFEQGVDDRSRREWTIIFVCNDGNCSTVAAGALLEQGVAGAIDIIGGFRAWRARGLPVTGPGTLST